MNVSIKTPEWIIQMNPREYKLWVEAGIFPERLKPLLKKEQEAKAENKKTKQKETTS